ncbi:MAG: hypothetical protein AAGG66_00265, partial [Methanothrix soehngenii]|uniref:hypothetical protein n=1 Tax=Methanothrix soehngenii TaxID=2223 RepID=UPI0031438ACE
MRSKETQLLGRLWISWHNIRLLYRETSAPSALDLIASITGDEKEKDEEKEDKEGQDESHPGSDEKGGE